MHSDEGKGDVYGSVQLEGWAARTTSTWTDLRTEIDGGPWSWM
jgi:hypothetical protein